jgi:hypothetical protein
MTELERADVRTAYRPLIEGLAGKPGTVSYDEWAAAVDRVFPTDGASLDSLKVRQGNSTKGRDEQARFAPHPSIPATEVSTNE